MGKIKIFLWSLILLGASLYIYYHLGVLSHRPRVPPFLSNLQMESLLKNITLSGKGKKGSWILTAQRVDVKEGESRLVMYHPKLEFDKKDERFFLSAKEGEYRRDKQFIHLWKEVKVRHRNITLSSNEAFYFIKSGYIQFDRRITLVSKSFKIFSNSAKINLNQNIVEFSGKVNFIMK